MKYSEKDQEEQGHGEGLWLYDIKDLRRVGVVQGLLQGWWWLNKIWNYKILNYAKMKLYFIFKNYIDKTNVCSPLLGMSRITQTIHADVQINADIYYAVRQKKKAKHKSLVESI